MILPVSLRPFDKYITERILREQNRSEVARIALAEYYARQDAEAAAAELLPELAARVEVIDMNIVRLCGLIERWLEHD